jgi:uncharacterized repeat protein (TIGR01451 family)
MRGSRSLRIASVVSTVVMLVLWGTVVAQAALLSKKQYAADVSPHSVSTSTSPTFTLTIANKANSQSLGSCNLTAPAGFTLQSTSQPLIGSATVVGNTLQLRNLSTPAMTSRAVSFVASTPATPGIYTWGIECRQANNYSPDQPSNAFTLDAANSNLKTTVSSPLPAADLAVSQTDSPDPVVGANTVQYTVAVSNSGPATSGDITLSDSLPSGGSISSIYGTGWTCTGSGASASCTSAPLASGTAAAPVTVLVLAPVADTTITNHVVVSQSGADDPNPGNNVSDESTTVKKDSSCTTGTISCGSGQITYGLFSSVTTGSTPSLQRFLVGTTTFQAVTGALGGQIWSMSAPAVPGSFCPLNFADNAVTQCTWQMNLDPIPAIYPVGKTTFVATCYVTKCPVGVIPGAGTIVVKVADDGTHQILPTCNGGTNECFEQARIAGNHLRITVRNLIAGDPRIAGVCVGGGC